VRHELVGIGILQLNLEVMRIFKEAGWLIYFEFLQGFDVGIDFEFA
jgi:hypothetical protein